MAGQYSSSTSIPIWRTSSIPAAPVRPRSASTPARSTSRAAAGRPAHGFLEGTRPIGLLILEGLLVREATVGDHPSAELLGPGDLLRAWDDVDAEELLPRTIEWSALDRDAPRRHRPRLRRARRAVAGGLRGPHRPRRPPRGAARGAAGDRAPHARRRPPARAALVPGRALGPRRPRRRARLAPPLAPHAGRDGRRAPPVGHHRARPADGARRARAPADGEWLLRGARAGDAATRPTAAPSASSASDYRAPDRGARGSGWKPPSRCRAAARARRWTGRCARRSRRRSCRSTPSTTARARRRPRPTPGTTSS